MATKIRKTSDLLTHIENKFEKRVLYLFRGQRQDKPLLPKLARYAKPGKALMAEKRLLSEFRRRSRPLLTVYPDNPWDWLAVAQHVGLATRLLDWTDNPLAALWFAVRKDSEKREDGVVWAFPVSEDDMVSEREIRGASPFNQPRTKVFSPKHIASTIVAQGGWFTVHKYFPDKEKFIPLENNTLFRDRMVKLFVDSKSFAPLREQLEMCGIHAASMFPDSGGLCEYLNWEAF